MEETKVEETQMRIRKAYEEGDVEESRELHDIQAAEEKHASQESGEIVKSFVFGGLDGIITTFAIVAAVAGAGLSTNTVILMGVANLVADGISMGLGDYLSEKAERNFVMHEFKREQWEMRNYPEGEVMEMIDIYVTEKQFTREDAEIVVKTVAKYPKAFVDLMCVDELGFIAPTDDGFPAWKKGTVTFFAFVFFGSVPVFVYVLAKIPKNEPAKNTLFAIAAIATAFTMFALGATKASFTKQHKTHSGLMMLINGSLAAAASYGIGFLLSTILNV